MIGGGLGLLTGGLGTAVVGASVGGFLDKPKSGTKSIPFTYEEKIP